MPHCGPVSSEIFSRMLGLPVPVVNQSLIRLETAGAVLRGRFTRHQDYDVTEWCDRRVLARIHRLTIGTLRKLIEPVTAAQFMRWLFRWQHVSPGTQLRGEHGTLEVLQQLQGFEIPAREWESQILSRR